MSILKAIGVRSAILSFLEIALFFLVITPLYFSTVGTICALATGQSVTTGMFLMPYAHLDQWSGILWIWMWLIEAVGYLLLITIYWAPGEAGLDEVELRGLVIFSLAAAVVGAVWLQTHGQYLSNIASTFWSIMNGSYGRGA